MADATWKESRILPVALTPDEVRERGELLARELETLANMETQQTAEKKEMKDDLDTQYGQVNQIARVVRDRIEQRPVEVECRLNMALGLVEEVRVDTGEIITTRNFREGDKLRLQQQLPGVEEKKPSEGMTE